MVLLNSLSIAVLDSAGYPVSTGAPVDWNLKFIAHEPAAADDRGIERRLMTLTRQAVAREQHFEFECIPRYFQAIV